VTIVGALALSLAAVPASANRGALNVARSELMRVHLKLSRAAQSDATVIQARDAARAACAALYQVRQNVLAAVRKSPEYADLRMALWAKQRQILGLHDELPVRVQTIMVSARDAMDLRAKLGAMDNAALEADETFVAAREDANMKLGLQQKTLRDALDAIRNDPEFAAASARAARSCAPSNQPPGAPS
jgi:hypothetical protein